MVIVKLLRCARLITTSRSRIFHYCLTTSNKIQLVAEYRLLGSSYTTFYWKMVNRTDTTRVWSTFTTISACYSSTLRICLSRAFLSVYAKAFTSICVVIVKTIHDYGTSA